MKRGVLEHVPLAPIVSVNNEAHHHLNEGHASAIERDFKAEKAMYFETPYELRQTTLAG